MRRHCERQRRAAIQSGRYRPRGAHLSLRRQWQGGAPIADVARLDLGLDQRLSPTVGLGLRLGFEDVKRLDSPVGDAQRRDAGLSLTKRFEHGALTLDMGVSRRFTTSDSVRPETSFDLSVRLGGFGRSDDGPGTVARRSCMR